MSNKKKLAQRPAGDGAQQSRKNEQKNVGQDQVEHSSASCEDPEITPKRDLFQALSPWAGSEPGAGARTKVTSPANPLVKMAKSLHLKKARAETGLFLAEGARLAAEAADLGVWPELLFVGPDAIERPAVARLLSRAQAAGSRIVETTPAILEQITKRDNAQTLVGAYRQRLADLAALDPHRSRLWVALEGVRDPGNFGTILRTADAVGAGGVILIGSTCDPFSVEAVRATMGSIFALPTARADFAAFDAWRRKGGLHLAGLSLKGRPWPEAALSGGVVALMGNEQSGLPGEMEAACDRLIKLPMKGRADSLNLAAATAVTLYDLWRRQGFDGARD